MDNCWRTPAAAKGESPFADVTMMRQRSLTATFSHGIQVMIQPSEHVMIPHQFSSDLYHARACRHSPSEIGNTSSFNMVTWAMSSASLGGVSEPGGNSQSCVFLVCASLLSLAIVCFPIHHFFLFSIDVYVCAAALRNS